MAATNGKEGFFHSGWPECVGDGWELTPGLLLTSVEEGLRVLGWCGGDVCLLPATLLSVERLRVGLLLSSARKAL
jgi:hypothetical protein